MEEITLAIAVEKTGYHKDNEIIGIGLSVVNENFQELDCLNLIAYFPKKHNFENIYWLKYWTKNLVILNNLEYDGELNKEERGKEILGLFREFLLHWENKAEENNYKLVFVVDDLFSIICLNESILKYFPEETYFRYLSNNIKDIESVYKGLTSFIRDKNNKDEDTIRTIYEYYNLPLEDRDHLESVSNDAYLIAFDYQISNAIAKRKLKKKNNFNFEEFILYIIFFVFSYKIFFFMFFNLLSLNMQEDFYIFNGSNTCSPLDIT